MLKRTRSHRLARAVAAMALASTAGVASAQDITAANPRVQDGRLLITGTTLSGNTLVRLDGKATAGFTVRSNNVTKAFALSVVYHPSDCIVTLQKVNPNNTLGAATNFVVGNCGQGFVARGAWTATSSYLPDDVVTSAGSTWRAKRANLNKTPVTGADWELVAARGAAGPIGPKGVQGPAGSTGPAGVAGAKGETGAAGPTGTKGNTGATGSVGPKGDTGAVGPAGAKGDTGAKGETGAAGPPGAKGDTGATGSVGPKGDTGATGAAGAKGDTGATGAKGAAGATGPAGAKGDTGATGATGAKGDAGATGAAGAKGDTGAVGAKGATGATGPAGAKGDIGATGSTGAKGDTGATGSTGAKGDTGAAGPAGAKGDTGATGAAGLNGPQGATGSTGLQGIQGPIGPQGPRGATGLVGPRGPGLKTVAAFFGSATCQNLDNSFLIGEPRNQGGCRVSWPSGTVDGFPIATADCAQTDDLGSFSDGSGYIGLVPSQAAYCQGSFTLVVTSVTSDAVPSNQLSAARQASRITRRR